MANVALKYSAKMSESEWKARQELAALYRVVDMMGWTELIYNHISLRLPDEEGAFLLNPFGLCYSEVTASNLIKIDIKGNKLCDSEYIANAGGFHFHGVVHEYVPDAHCVIHTHTTAGVAVASLAEDIIPTNNSSIPLLDGLAYHDFAIEPLAREVEGPAVAKALGHAHSIIMRNHGLLAVGPTVPATFYRMWNLQRACEIHLAAAAAGPLRRIPDDVCRATMRTLDMAKAPDGKRTLGEAMGEADFAAMIRKIDRIDPSWRD